jgi:hypothetical protein
MTATVEPARRAGRTGQLVDARTDVKVVLAGVWIAGCSSSPTSTSSGSGATT